MALLVLLFLDLASLPLAPAQARGDEALYLQALADHRLAGPYSIEADPSPCAQVARSAWDLVSLYAPFVKANQQPKLHRLKASANFSRIGWDGLRAWLQLTTFDATSCLLYRRSGASYQLVREIRLPQ